MVAPHGEIMNLSGIPLSPNATLEPTKPSSEGGYSSLEIALIVLITGILSVVTVVGNLLVMVSFKVNRELKTVNNYFLLSLAAADLIIGTISMNLYTTYIVMGQWVMGSLACDLWLALDYVASNASVMSLLLISFDRYFSITHPLTYRAKRTPKRATVMIVMAWLISFVLWAPAILFWQKFVGKRTVAEHECYIQFFSEPIITFGTAIAAFYLPVTIMVVLYWRIYQETQKRAKELCGLQGSEFKKNLDSSASGTTRDGGSGGSSSSSSEPSHPLASSSTTGGLPLQKCCFAKQRTDDLYIEQSSNGSWNTTEEEEAGEASADSLTSSEGEEQPFEVHKVCSAVIHLPMIGTIMQPPREAQRRDPKAVAGMDWVGGKVFVAIPKQPLSMDKRLKKVALMEKTPVMAKNQVMSAGRKRRRRRSLSKRKTLSLMKEKKAARTLSAILLAFLITWTPYNIMVLVSTFCEGCIPQSLWELGYWLCYVNSTVNPMCYALCNRSFRTTFRRLLQCHGAQHR
ncbi:muscarinic acetylcholine receptor M1 [Sceloporus undulatus]|uniref:muscarinic acetylcholine receptor M1 n=1 Tax=Sceloporus undulatus TaxID=8520 RepID=UPI001C4BE8DF|nr:muscarinic acetylcholine receptor M1 [Sceloporus undulatus]XP_042296388.1 muscarinic acetylcholine receptor M1 [Sceloporus undulatus]